MKIHRPNPQSLIVTKSRLKGFASFSIGWAVFGFVFWNFFELGTISEGTNLFEHIKEKLSTDPLLWFFVLAPVLSLPAIYNMLKIIAVGDRLSFDGMMRTISKNQKPVAKFDEVEHLQIRTIKGQGSPGNYLTAVLRSGKKIKIHTGGDSDEIIALADDVADIMKVSVIHKK